MRIRDIHPSDLVQLMEIHGLYFKEEFTFPDFLNFLCAFVIEDEEGIITVGGIRNIAEVVMLTDKSRTPIQRMAAFHPLLSVYCNAGRRLNFDQLHCFIMDEKWSKRLQKTFNFRPTKGQALVLDI